MKGNNISILFSGDLAPIGIAEEKPYNPATLKIDASLHDIINNCDLMITNLECPLTESNNKIIKTGPHLKAHPHSIKTLELLKIDVACLSNNHIRDYNDQGVLDTINICKNSGIRTVGAGKDKMEASTPIFIEIKYKTIAILNFSESEFNAAGENHAGSNPDDPIHIWNSLQKAKSKADYQIVIMHGGKEMHPYPTPYQVKLFRFIANQGVDAVIGHHTHIIGGYEIYNNKPIIYSLGNFLFDESGNPPEWYHGALVKIVLDTNNNKTEVEFFHVNFHSKKLEVQETLNIRQTENGTSFIKPINLVEIKEQWQKLIEKQYFGVVKSVLNLDFAERVLIKLKLINLHRKTRFLLQLGNLFRCKTHRNFNLDVIDYFINKNKLK